VPTNSSFVASPEITNVANKFLDSLIDAMFQLHVHFQFRSRINF
jgi:hypothetical protein